MCYPSTALLDCTTNRWHIGSVAFCATELLQLETQEYDGVHSCVVLGVYLRSRQALSVCVDAQTAIWIKACFPDCSL